MIFITHVLIILRLMLKYYQNFVARFLENKRDDRFFFCWRLKKRKLCSKEQTKEQHKKLQVSFEITT